MTSLFTDPVLLMASAAAEITALDKFKDFVNHWSVPQYSLPLFCLLMLGAFFGYRKWTKPAIFWPLMGLFTIVYFGFIPLDDSYASILKKPDNVPISMMIFLTLFFLWLGLRQAAINDRNMEIGKPLIEEDREDKVLCWPDLVYPELLAMVLCTFVLIVWSVLLKAPLESPANPAGPPNPSKAPWYFLGLQEMLVYFDPWMAGVVLPGLIILGLAAMPYIDTNPKGNGYYTFKERKFAIITWMFGYLILWCVLIVFGTFLRGPNWNFFGPFETSDSHRVEPLTNIIVSDIWNARVLKQKLPDSILLREWPGMLLTVFWMFILPFLMTKIRFFGRLRTQMGFARFYLMAVLFVIMMLVPVKMVGRWTINLKYIIAMPEYSFNL